MNLSPLQFQRKSEKNLILAFAKAAAPISPILLKFKSKEVREEFDSRAFAKAIAPVSPILFQFNFKEVREEFDSRAFAKAAAPFSPI